MVARTRTVHRPVGPLAYDCVKIIVVRDGSAILFSEFGQQPVKVGDAIVLAANTLCGSEPEGHITVTTIYADTDYVIDQVFWQHVGFLQDRLDALEFAATVYTEPAQILRLGEDRAGQLMPWLDELVALSIEARPVETSIGCRRSGSPSAMSSFRSSRLRRSVHPRRNARRDGRPSRGIAGSHRSVTRPGGVQSYCVLTRYDTGQ